MTWTVTGEAYLHGKDRQAAERRVAALLPTENDIDTGNHLCEILLPELRRALGKKPLADRDDLRDIRHGILRQSRYLCRQHNVARRTRPGQIVRQRHANHCREPTAVQVVTLHDHDRPADARTGSGGLVEIGPPHLTLQRAYHSLRASARRAASVTNGSATVANSSTSWFMDSVTSSGACLARYSESASA